MDDRVEALELGGAHVADVAAERRHGLAGRRRSRSPRRSRCRGRRRRGPPPRALAPGPSRCSRDAGDENLHCARASSSRSLATSVSAAWRRERRGAPTARRRRASEWSPSARLSTQRTAWTSASLPPGTPALSVGRGRARRVAARLRDAVDVAAVSVDDVEEGGERRDRVPRARRGRAARGRRRRCGAPGSSPCGVRVSATTGRSKPGEQNCRSSVPHGTNGAHRPRRARGRRALAARSVDASCRGGCA